MEVGRKEGPGKVPLLKCPLKGSNEDIKVVASPPTGTLTFLFTAWKGNSAHFILTGFPEVDQGFIADSSPSVSVVALINLRRG